MSVPEGKRTKSSLEVFESARRLALHTCECVANTNVFKGRYRKVSERIPWLGFTFELRPTGKVIQRIRPEKVRQERRKLRRMANMVRDGTMTREKCDECFSSWLGYARRNCDDAATHAKMKRYYDSLWRNEC